MSAFGTFFYHSRLGSLMRRVGNDRVAAMSDSSWEKGEKGTVPQRNWPSSLHLAHSWSPCRRNYEVAPLVERYLIDTMHYCGNANGLSAKSSFGLPRLCLKNSVTRFEDSVWGTVGEKRPVLWKTMLSLFGRCLGKQFKLYHLTHPRVWVMFVAWVTIYWYMIQGGRNSTFFKTAQVVPFDSAKILHDVWDTNI